VPVTLKKLLDSPDDYEGVRVRLQASLMNRVEGSMGQTLVLEASNVIFTAHIEVPQAEERFQALKPGSKVALTGVFVAQPPIRWPPHLSLSREKADPRFYYAPPESVQVLLNSSADVTVLQPPPWWTLARLLWVLGIMSLILVAGLLWVFVLNNRVRRQTRIIQEKVKREGVLEERNRIAREFHDTLEQELVAVAIQLDAVAAEFSRSPEAARRQLDLARNMSRHSHSEARRSVWDMRSHLLESGDLSSALTEMAASLSPASKAKIAVECTGAPRRLAAVTEHHLLRIAQEAVANALKHSGASCVKLALNYAPTQVQLLLQDDGRGFDQRAAKGVDNGHFGLLDMKERAEKIGARFSLATLPGQGTEIRVTVTDGVAG
jgi:signal transduction histidine kinase